jgi:hypothetical protein
MKIDAKVCFQGDHLVAILNPLRAITSYLVTGPQRVKQFWQLK